MFFNSKKAEAMKRDEQVKLGCIAKDSITEFTGVVVAITEWLNGCRRITIQPKELKDGKPIDGHTFDAEQVELVQVAKPTQSKPKGGPRIEPTNRANPSR